MSGNDGGWTLTTVLAVPALRKRLLFLGVLTLKVVFFYVHEEYEHAKVKI